jgi:pimeloyl-ACP methyl ester carboxylesterase
MFGALFTAEVLIGILIAYVVINLLAYAIQERFIFKPEKLPQDFEYKYDYPFEELFFDIKPGVRINGLRFKTEGLAKGLMLYFHGNTRSIKGWGKYSQDFTRHGWDVIMIDYRGFGKSTGKRTERELKSDAQFIYEKLKEEMPETHIIVYGRSIGSGFATKLAATNHPRMLLLDAPYYSFSSLTKRYLPFLPIAWILRYPIRTDKWIKYCKCPIRIIHGTDDWLVPFKHSVRLAKVMPHQTVLYPIIGGKHNNLPSFAQYHETVEKILHEAESLPDNVFTRHNVNLF